MHGANSVFSRFKGHGDDIYMSGEHVGPGQEPTSAVSEKAEHHSSIVDTGPTSAASLFSNPVPQAQPTGEPGTRDETHAQQDASPTVEGSHPADPPASSDVTVSSHDGSLFESTSVYKFSSVTLRLLISCLFDAVRILLLTNLTLLAYRALKQRSQSPYEPRPQSPLSLSKLKRPLRLSRKRNLRLTGMVTLLNRCNNQNHLVLSNRLRVNRLLLR